MPAPVAALRHATVALGAWWRAALVLAWVAGVASQSQQPELWPWPAYPLLFAAGLLGCLAAGRCRRLAASRLVACVAIAALGFAYAGWRADVRIADALAPEWEGRDVELAGTIAEMPQVAEDGQHFAFTVDSARALPMTPNAVKRLTTLDAAAGRPLDPRAIPLAPKKIPAPDDESAGDDATVDAMPPQRGATPRVPSRIWLAWNGNPRDDRTVAAMPAALRAGQRWRLPVRLRLPHGVLNPDGFDSELWLFDQGLRATGTVQGPGVLESEGWAPIENARQWVRDHLLLLASAAPSPAEAQADAALAALAVGDQAAIDGPGWEVFRNAGVAHLMSISGLHITMLGWLGGRGIGALWRRSERAALWVATPIAARWGGLGIAWLYALIAGWGVPAQRTVVMLAATALLRSVALDWPAVLVTLAAMVPVTLLDPWALLQPGFWLSFAAVGLLMGSEPVRLAPAALPAPAARAATSAPAGRDPAMPGTTPRGRVAVVVTAFVAALRRAAAAVGGELRGGVRAQVIASVGLAPLSLVAFQQVSLVGLLSNLVAEPWVTLVVTPLALLGILVPGLWGAAALALRPMLALLGWLSRWPFASVHVPSAPGWSLVVGLAGGALLMLALPWRVRLLGVPMLLPLCAPVVERPAPGRFELVAADIGQGSAVLVRTHSRLLLFDTGPRFGEGSDAGVRILLPLLQARGERRIDTLMLSHADADHVGGAQSLIDRFPVLALRSSLDAGNPLRRNALPHVPCLAGQAWQWDGVRFEVMHPFAADYRPGAKTNAISCVLRVRAADGASALLTGDIEAPQEAVLVARDAGALRSDVLVVPHHGSRTSSTAAFLQAVRPQVAVMQVGYRNRYGHPAPEVVARDGALRVPVVRTDQCGAWSWNNGGAVCTRAVRRRYWGWQGTSANLSPARIAARSAVASAGSDVAIQSTRVAARRGADTVLAGGSPSSP